MDGGTKVVSSDSPFSILGLPFSILKAIKYDHRSSAEAHAFPSRILEF